MSSNRIDQEQSEMHEALVPAEKALLSSQSSLQKGEGALARNSHGYSKTKESQPTLRFRIEKKNVIKWKVK